MTYRELLRKLHNIPSDRLDDNVTIYDPNQDEYIPSAGFFQSYTDVLDDGHYVIELKA
jgi:hypothetical protein